MPSAPAAKLLLRKMITKLNCGSYPVYCIVVSCIAVSCIAQVNHIADPATNSESRLIKYPQKIPAKL
jgi:hypothetical protein